MIGSYVTRSYNSDHVLTLGCWLLSKKELKTSYYYVLASIAMLHGTNAKKCSNVIGIKGGSK